MSALTENDILAGLGVLHAAINTLAGFADHSRKCIYTFQGDLFEGVWNA